MGRLAMTIAEPMVLPADVVLVPVSDLPEETRSVLEHKTGDFAVTRPRTRTTSSIVDSDTAGLLERFRDPKTIVEAIVEYARARGLDPNETLERAFPMLAGFLNTGMLVPAGSEFAAPIEPTISRGERVGTFTVIEPVHVIDDTEVHLARAGDGSLVALKVARAAGVRELRHAFDHEASILRALDGSVTPRLVERNRADDREFLAVAWCHGVDATEAAAELRETEDAAGLLALAERVLAAYARIHAQGVLHGDVHPRNVVVDSAQEVRLIDFGLAGRAGLATAMPRGGIDLFLEPELARARLAKAEPPALSAAGEQYSVAALVYLLLTGAYTHAFSLEEERMLRQLTEEAPLPFAAHGARAVAQVETTLARALAKEPSERFASVDELRSAFAAAARSAPRSRRPQRPTADALVAEVVERLRGPLLERELEPPTASVNLGAAGIAYGVLRIAETREDPELLSLAERWSHRALVATATDDGFENAELEIVPERYGTASLFHSAVGVHCVEALVAAARGDALAQAIATERFVAAVRSPSSHLDVAFGTAGALLACAQLLEAAGETDAVAAAGDELERTLLDALENEPPLGAGGAHPLLGAAHGWSGFLHAILRWSEARGRSVPASVAGRLDELAALGVPFGRGVRFPREAGLPSSENALASSWCNGAAGHVHLWLGAARILREPRFEQLAEATAWTAYDAPDAGGDLCCGAAGRAYALLAVHRHAGGDAWLDRAVVLAERAAHAVRREALRHDSLYKGDVGVAVLAAELSKPDWAALPLYEREGTPDRKESP